MLNKKIASIALFMIVLIIMIPVYSSYAIATSFSVYTITGNDGVNGYRKQNDVTLITAQADIDGDADITPNQVKFGTDNFSSCVNIGGGLFQCSYSSVQFPITPKSYTVMLYLLDNNNVSLLAASSEITVDNQAPTISSFDTAQTSVGIANISFSYSVSDTACADATCAGKCSGINFINIYKDSTLLQKIDIDSSLCAVSSAFSLNTLQLASASGDVSVCITAYDKLNFSSSAACKTLSVDLIPPEIDESSFAIENDNVPVYYVSPSGISADISVEISEEGSGLGTVSADLSKINPIYAASVPADSCTGPGTFTCFWNNRIVTANSTKVINVTAVDNAGNVKTKQIIYGFGVDNTAPDITFIGTTNIYAGASYIVSGYNTLKVTLAESESGVDINTAYLDLSAIGGGAAVKAHSCTASGSTRDCYWYNVTSTLANNAEAKIWIYGDLKDKSGNAYTGLTYGMVKADLLTPSLDLISISSFDAFGSHNYTKSGDLLTIAVNVAEDKSLIATGNFSGVGLGENIPGACVAYNSSRWSCSWQTSAVASGYLSTYLKFNFSDPFGNSLLYSYPIEVFAVSNETSPNYWNIGAVKSLPYALDMGAMKLIEQRMYFSIPITTINPNAEILSMELTNCDGDTDYLANEPQLINAEHSLNPYVLLQFGATSDNLTELIYNCSLNIMSQVGNMVMDYPEVENLSLVVHFYKSEIGEYGQNIEDKIKEEKASWIVSNKWISTLKKFLYYAQKICNLMNTFVKIQKLWQVISTELTALQVVTQTVPPAEASVAATRVATQTSEAAYSGTFAAGWAAMHTFCKFVSCRLWFSGKFSAAGKIQSTMTTLINKASDPTGLLKKYTGVSALAVDEKDKSIKGMLNVQDSIVLSILTLCIPGIIYNLEKYRQIKCQYVGCLKDQVPQGIPISACDAVQSQETCKYFVGELFKVFSWTAFFDYLTGMVKQLLSNPLALIGFLSGWVCKPLALIPKPAETGFKYIGCEIAAFLSLIGDIIADLKDVSKGWKIENDYCANI